MTNSKILKANRLVHASLIASGDYKKSPHRKLENRNRVRNRLSELAAPVGAQHLDVACGDGFIFECCPKGWVSTGVDATKEMLSECKKNHPSVKLELGLAEDLPFPDKCFDIVTCYSFLDHLECTEKFYREAFRVLRPGGSFYFGLNPNVHFALSLSSSDFTKAGAGLENVDLESEKQKTFSDGLYYEEKYKIPADVLADCEPGKTSGGGMSPEVEVNVLARVGFSEIQVSYDWVVQQNRLDEGQVSILNNFLPFSRGCFKYFEITGKS